MQVADSSCQAGESRKAALEQAQADLHELQRLAAALQVCLRCKGLRNEISAFIIIWFLKGFGLGSCLHFTAHHFLWASILDSEERLACRKRQGHAQGSTALYRADFGNAGGRGRGEAAAAVDRQGQWAALTGLGLPGSATGEPQPEEGPEACLPQAAQHHSSSTTIHGRPPVKVKCCGSEGVNYPEVEAAPQSCTLEFAS